MAQGYKLGFWAFFLVLLILFFTPISFTLVNDKVSHAIAYGALFYLAAKTYKDRYSATIIAILVFLLGSLVEVLQSMTGYRSGEVYDILANTLGIGLVGALTEL